MRRILDTPETICLLRFSSPIPLSFFNALLLNKIPSLEMIDNSSSINSTTCSLELEQVAVMMWMIDSDIFNS